MASTGKIESAIRRARQRIEGVTPAAPLPVNGAQRQTPRAIPEFPLVPYDPDACEANRILIPDLESSSRVPGSAAYRVLRTRIMQRARAHSWRTVGVTSAGQGDGKSLTALNLALTIAREANNEVFLIDLDMRSPKVCEYLGTTPPTDINKYLAGEASVEDVLFSIGVDHLTVAGTRTSTDQASELLATGRVEELFAYIRDIAPNAFALVDLPPLLSTDDALVIAPRVDACLLVLSEGKSRRDSTAKALDLIAEFNLAGIVLNRSASVIKDYYNS